MSEKFPWGWTPELWNVAKEWPEIATILLEAAKKIPQQERLVLQQGLATQGAVVFAYLDLEDFELESNTDLLLLAVFILGWPQRRIVTALNVLADIPNDPAMQAIQQAVFEDACKPDPFLFREAFGIAEVEEQTRRVTDKRFQQWFDDEHTIINRITLGSKQDKITVTLSRPAEGVYPCLTFHGLGFDRRKGHYVVDEWEWFIGHPPNEEGLAIPYEEAAKIIEERRKAVQLLTSQQDQPNETE